MSDEQWVLREIERQAQVRPSDIHDVAFSTTRLRPGYDEDQWTSSSKRRRRR